MIDETGEPPPDLDGRTAAFKAEHGVKPGDNLLVVIITEAERPCHALIDRSPRYQGGGLSTNAALVLARFRASGRHARRGATAIQGTPDDRSRREAAFWIALRAAGSNPSPGSCPLISDVTNPAGNRGALVEVADGADPVITVRHNERKSACNIAANEENGRERLALLNSL